MESQEILRDVPADKLAMVLAQYQSVGATVQLTPQSDGKFTVTATFHTENLAPLAMGNVVEADPVTKHEQLEAILSEHTKPISSHNFSDISDEYRRCYDTFVVSATMQAQIDAITARVLQVSSRYIQLAQQLHLPWELIALIHKMESDTNFSTHLHNGDPLTDRTVRVPTGRPKTGSPPFRWEDSARDALLYEGYVGLTDWNTATLLFRLERFNGFGYRDKGIFSPYLWGGSNLYVKGRYVKDHVFDPDSVSVRCGAAVLLKGLRRVNATDT